MSNVSFTHCQLVNYPAQLVSAFPTNLDVLSKPRALSLFIPANGRNVFLADITVTSVGSGLGWMYCLHLFVKGQLEKFAALPKPVSALRSSTFHNVGIYRKSPCGKGKRRGVYTNQLEHVEDGSIWNSMVLDLNYASFLQCVKKVVTELLFLFRCTKEQ
jgi:hypothetical protein